MKIKINTEANTLEILSSITVAEIISLSQVVNISDYQILPTVEIKLIEPSEPNLSNVHSEVEYIENNYPNFDKTYNITKVVNNSIKSEVEKAKFVNLTYYNLYNTMNGYSCGCSYESLSLEYLALYDSINTKKLKNEIIYQESEQDFTY